MIGYLSGKIMDTNDRDILLKVGSDTSSVGYLLHVPSSNLGDHYAVGAQAEFYVHTHAREDALELFGFASLEEKNLFLTIRSVQGVGPKTALGILSHITPQDFIHAILTSNKDVLKGLPGIGKKTAERMALELIDPIKKKIEAGVFQLNDQRPTGASAAEESSNGKSEVHQNTRFKDALGALVGLGYKPAEAEKMLKDVESLSSDAMPDIPESPEEWVRLALRNVQ